MTIFIVIPRKFEKNFCILLIKMSAFSLGGKEIPEKFSNFHCTFISQNFWGQKSWKMSENVRKLHFFLAFFIINFFCPKIRGSGNASCPQMTSLSSWQLEVCLPLNDYLLINWLIDMSNSRTVFHKNASSFAQARFWSSLIVPFHSLSVCLSLPASLCIFWLCIELSLFVCVYIAHLRSAWLWPFCSVANILSIARTVIVTSTHLTYLFTNLCVFDSAR